MRKKLIKMLFTILVNILITVRISVLSESKIRFTWRCEFHQRSRCIKKLASEILSENIQSLKVCNLFCGASSIIWPKPVHSSVRGSPIHVKNILFENKLFAGNSLTETQNIRFLLAGAINVFTERIKKENGTNIKTEMKGHTLKVSFKLKDSNDIKLMLKTNESYHLNIQKSWTEPTVINALIEGETFYGVRHGLETLSQLIVYDNVNEGLVIPEKAEIIDFPKYPYRGLMVDTSRNYITVDSIKRTIDAMSANKMNRFHWHLTDTHSFPIKLKKYDMFTEYGAYSPEKVYTELDIKSIMEYAMVRGVSIVPELDAPAHTGEGWQSVPDALTCFNIQPWDSYCVEPPCGQLNPLVEAVYETLGGLYQEFLKLFQTDLFHMGGDEVSLACWKTSRIIRDWIGSKSEDTAFFKLWNNFQEKAYNELTKASEAANKPEPEVILWTSKLTTEHNLAKLKQNNYIIQVWDSKLEDKAVTKKLLDNGFRIILSNYDALYLDCGYGSWVTSGTDWCYPYKTWHTVYTNSLENVMEVPKEKKHFVLGQEAVLWTETATEESLDLRVWPRVAALAERTWSDPDTKWQAAESRFLYHRERLVQLGIKADAIQPEWCNINYGGCANYDSLENSYHRSLLLSICIYVIINLFIYLLIKKIRQRIRRRLPSSPKIKYSHLQEKE